MVFLIIIPMKNGYTWEYTQHFQTNPYDRGMVFGKVNNSADSASRSSQLPIQVLQNGLGDTMDVRAVQVPFLSCGRPRQPGIHWAFSWAFSWATKEINLGQFRFASQVAAAECSLYQALMLR